MRLVEHTFAALRGQLQWRLVHSRQVETRHHRLTLFVQALVARLRLRRMRTISFSSTFSRSNRRLRMSMTMSMTMLIGVRGGTCT